MKDTLLLIGFVIFGAALSGGLMRYLETFVFRRIGRRARAVWEYLVPPDELDRIERRNAERRAMYRREAYERRSGEAEDLQKRWEQL